MLELKLNTAFVSLWGRLKQRYHGAVIALVWSATDAMQTCVWLIDNRPVVDTNK